ncbi:hypothetical protein ANCCAN_23551 [Ancylostoma caninum]|uniref:Uncharacterized protein n=1 Tax=Ancylostoma caninum TaxID=29170 RepID=A0A368FF33_ANCCA|nr:hypothetical protein ANCCAN_23551 [Ancylostoma caninum]
MKERGPSETAKFALFVSAKFRKLKRTFKVVAENEFLSTAQQADLRCGKMEGKLRGRTGNVVSEAIIEIRAHHESCTNNLVRMRRTDLTSLPNRRSY